MFEALELFLDPVESISSFTRWVRLKSTVRNLPVGYELRCVALAKRWVRDDPITVLAPGARVTAASRFRLGTTMERSSEVSVSMGISGKVGLGELSKQLSTKLSQQITLTVERECTYTTELANDLSSGSRRYALWHVQHSVTTSAALANDDGPRLETRATLDYSDSDAVYIDSP